MSFLNLLPDAPINIFFEVNPVTKPMAAPKMLSIRYGDEAISFNSALNKIDRS